MKKGFTLIELLAVIVILAIIALIATPIVLDIIDDTKKSAAERTADNYIEAVEIAVATAKLDGNNIPDGTYTINNKGNLEGNGLEKALTIEMNGNKPSSGTVKISNGQVTTDSTMIIGSYEVAYNSTNKKYEATEPYKGTLCTKASDVDLNNLTYGNEFTCELGDNNQKTFYVLETSGDNVSLIMNANVDSNGKAITPDNIPADKGLVAWISKDDYIAAGGKDLSNDEGACMYDHICSTNDYGPITAEATLEINTKGWTKLVSSQITLPTAIQIATASRTTFDDSIINNLPTWLYDYLDGTTNSVSGIYGYWTSSSYTSNDRYAWGVYYDISGTLENVNLLNSYGVRPVITISKSQLD